MLVAFTFPDYSRGCCSDLTCGASNIRGNASRSSLPLSNNAVNLHRDL